MGVPCKYKKLWNKTFLYLHVSSLKWIDDFNLQVLNKAGCTKRYMELADAYELYVWKEFNIFCECGHKNSVEICQHLCLSVLYSTYSVPALAYFLHDGADDCSECWNVLCWDQIWGMSMLCQHITASVRFAVRFACHGDGGVLHFLEGTWHHSPEVLDVSINGYVAPYHVIFSNTDEPGYTEVSLCDTSSIVSDILWYQFISHC
jgi:hypothetical protein